MPPKKKVYSEDEAEEPEKVSSSPAKKSKTGHTGSEPHIRDIIVPKDLVDGHSFVKVMSWNVNGMKALASKNLNVLTNLVATHKPDVLCLQETKLQVSQVDEFRDILSGYDSYWSCSVDKKGYSGTAVFINKATIATNNANAEAAVGASNKASATAAATAAVPKKKQSKLTSYIKKVDAEPVIAAAVVTTPLTESSATTSTSTATPLLQLQRVSFDFEDDTKRFGGEGRTITVELNNVVIVACYVPNSGEGLVRLDYRTKEWDPFVRAYLNKLSARKPVIFTGDLNVGHLDLDIHNPTAKHIGKQAGLTERERSSHSELLQQTNFKDAFRYLYPDARGQFTYWSQRTFARPVNKGIRLDYFVCSQDMFAPTSTTTVTAATESVTQDKKSDKKIKSTDSIKSTTEALDETTLQTAVYAVRTEVSVEDTPSPGVWDCYQLPEDTKGVSDHAPVVLVVKI